MDINTLPPNGFVSKIAHTIKERLCAHMPHFYDHEDYRFGKITVTPKGLGRFRIGTWSPVPYVTMSKIEFTLRIEKLHRSSYNVYLQLADNSYRTLATITKTETPIEGVAMYTGDTKIFFAPSSYSDASSEKFIAKEGLLLFEDNLQHTNQYVWGGCSVAALLLLILGVALSLLSGLIQVTPERVIWWPW